MTKTQVEWRKRELRCTPAIGFFAGQELLFVYDEHPERVPWMCHRDSSTQLGVLD